MSEGPHNSTRAGAAVSPRALVISHRNFRPTICRTSQNEYEDVIASTDAVDLVAPWVKSTTHLLPDRWARRVSNKLKIDVVHRSSPATVTLTRDYELCFVVVQHPSDLSILDGVPGWRERCKKAVVFVEELWLTDMGYEKMLRLMSPFNTVVCSCQQTLGPLEKILDVPCVWDGIGVDALRFCPLPLLPERSIDFLSIGRRSEKTHAAFLELSRTTNFFYIHDTMNGTDVLDSTAHRDQLAARVKRAKFFLANKPKVNQSDHRGRQEEIGMRFYEGAAGGAVMVGDPPVSPRFADHFGYEDACIRLEYDSTDVAAFLSDLNQQPERLARVRRNHVVNCLLHHDWVYRWQKVLELAGLPETPGMAERVRRLRHQADLANSTEFH